MNKIHHFFQTLAVMCFFSATVVFAQGGDKPFVIPEIKTWTSKHHKAVVPIKTLLIDAHAEETLRPYVETFSRDLKDAGYADAVIKVGKPTKNAIYFTLGKFKDLGEEGYRLNIDEAIRIEANTPLGAFWATRTLLQMWEQGEALPFGQIVDYPDYPVRGFMLDVGRKFFSIDFLRNYVKLMAYYKMNDFHIHLNDNAFVEYHYNDWNKTYSAFRLQNDTFPELTAKDGSYSKKEFRDLQRLAQAYGVHILPEIDVPAHSLAFTQMMPELASKKYGADHLDLENPKVYEVIDKVFKEYLEGDTPVFMGKEVHIGTDEYAQEAAEQFRAFTDHYIKYVESFGKKARFWGALTHAKGKIPVKVKEVSMNVWYNGYANPNEMIKLGYNIISTPDALLYIVPMAGYYHDFLNNQKLYNEWAPNHIGDQIFKHKHPQIKGGSFAVWNDMVGNGISERDVHTRVFHSMQVLSQKMWKGNQATLSYQDFAMRAKQIGEGPKLNMLGNILKNEHSELLIKDTATLNTRNEEVALPYDGLGYDYSVSFEIYPKVDNQTNAVVFSNRDTEFRLKQGKTHQLGFSRDGYNFNFNYTVPAEKWTKITIVGNKYSTALYVEGKLVERLNPYRQFRLHSNNNVFNTVATLFFPLSNIGKAGNSFVGKIKNIKIYNYEIYQ